MAVNRVGDFLDLFHCMFDFKGLAHAGVGEHFRNSVGSALIDAFGPLYFLVDRS